MVRQASTHYLQEQIDRKTGSVSNLCTNERPLRVVGTLPIRAQVQNVFLGLRERGMIAYNLVGATDTRSPRSEVNRWYRPMEE